MAIEVRPITATLGAEISGVDMADVSGETLEQLRKAWLDHKVLVLRDQHISVEEHIAFGRRFGDLEVHPFAVGKKGYPEVVKIKSTAEYQYAANNWHSDVTWRAEPSMGSILRGVVIPPAGGAPASRTPAPPTSVSARSGRIGSTRCSPFTTSR